MKYAYAHRDAVKDFPLGNIQVSSLLETNFSCLKRENKPKIQGKRKRYSRYYVSGKIKEKL